MINKFSRFYVLVTLISIIILISSFAYASLSSPKSLKSGVKTVLIGVSQANLRDPWRLVMLDELRTEANKYPNIKLIIKDAYNNVNAQLNDIQELIGFGCDILIVSPIDSKVIGTAISTVNKKIPVILLDRLVDGYGYSVFVGPDNHLIGRNVGKSVISLSKGAPTTVLEIMGMNDLLSKSRHEGFIDAISNNNITLKTLQVPSGQRDDAEDLLLDYKDKLNEIDIIFCHNDYLALGICRAIETLNLESDIKIISIDGFDTENGGLHLLKNDKIDVNITCPTGGKEAIILAIDLINKVSGIPKQYILRNYILTKENLIDYTNRFERTEKDISKVKIGHVQIVDESGWRNANKDSISKAAKNFNINLKYVSGNDREDQIQIINDFINEKMDIIILSPVVSTGYDDILQKCKDNKIPVFLADRMVNVKDDSLYYTFIGADFEEEGRRAARWLVKEKRTGSIFEIQGTDGASPTILRHSGFNKIIKEYKTFTITNSVYSNYSREGGYEAIENYYKEKGSINFDILYTHNDDMALGALQALKDLDIKVENICFISIDGTKEALNEIKNGVFDCSVECTPLLGEQLIKAIKDYTEGTELPRKIITDEEIFTTKNVVQALPSRLY